MNFPDAYNARSYPAINKPEQCGGICLGDCSCTAYSISRSLETGNRNCITWSGDLVDIRSYSDEGAKHLCANGGWEEEKQNRIDRRYLCLHLGFGSFGVLASGEEIAVKKLSEISKQGLDEFRTEVRSISGLRHINIARLYGWSVYKEEKLLIYEYLVNGSLERHLFGGGELNWQTRFHIIKGVAQGLAYIEEGRYNLILHRDLKPDNILLDRDMTPKISDFGLARMCARSEKEVFTQHTAGTHGYISPESLLDGIFSSASDVFSFGVIVLEIVNGKRNRSFSSSIGYLLGYAWNKYNEGNWSEIIDEKIRQDCVESWQVLRCIEVGLLCSQYFARDRPKISLVVAQLQEETIEIQKPKRPGFYPIDEGESGIPSSSNLQGESSTLLPIQLPPTRFQT
ncbi:hypothetical protein Bca4012_030967 [Brassica carinata]